MNFFENKKHVADAVIRFSNKTITRLEKKWCLRGRSRKIYKTAIVNKAKAEVLLEGLKMQPNVPPKKKRKPRKKRSRKKTVKKRKKKSIRKM